jgi:hypothetical protein
MKCKKINLGDGQMIKFLLGFVLGVFLVCSIVVGHDDK